MTHASTIASRTGALLLAALCGYGLVSASVAAGPPWASLALAVGWAALAGWTLTLARREARGWEVAVLLAAALLLRVGCLALVAGAAPRGDAAMYPEIARNLLAGRGLVVVEPFMGEEVRALYPPLYPLLLAAWGALFGLGGAALVALNAVIDGATAWLIVGLARRVEAGRAGTGAALLYLIWPSVVMAAPFAAKEGLIALLVLALAIAWLDAARGASGAAVRVGVVAGLLVLTQPALAPLAGLVGVALLRDLGWRRLVQTGAAAAGVSVLVMLPWWARNAAVFHAFVPLTSAGGYSLWIGNNPEATGNWMPPPPELRGLPELAFGKAAGAIARAWMTAHPVDVVHLTIAKFLRASAIGTAEATRIAGVTPAPPSAIAGALRTLAYGAHLALVAGAALALWRRAAPPRLALLLGAGLAQIALFGVWFEFGERHRGFLTAPLLLAAVTLVARHSRSSLPGGLALASSSSSGLRVS